MMITYHTAFALSYLGIARMPVTTGFPRLFALSTASLFIFLAGVSLHISRSRGGPQGRGAKGFVLRGAGIFSLGLVINAATFVFIPESPVVFGILHFLGTMIIIGPVLPHSPWKNYLLGTVAIITGFLFLPITGLIWTIPFGIRPAPFASLDYVPLFPWAGIFLFGLGAGALLYPGGVPHQRWSAPHSRTVEGATYLGRHSLVIYMIHVPIILAILGILYPEVWSTFLPS